MTKRRWPVHGWLGLALVAVAWPLNWTLEGLRTHWCFFPLWLGYCLTVDALSVRRTGTSLLTRGRGMYVGLFLISAPVWWLFELANLRTGNWHYLGRDQFSDLEYALLATASFSTVIPAVLGTAELVAGFGLVRRLRHGPAIGGGRHAVSALAATGVVLLILMLAWPLYFFPFLWISLYCLFESLNLRRGNRTLSDWTRRGEWRPLAALALGVLICGFFWEMWNSLSYPKWVYTVPWFGFWHVFEMPLVGYLGYLPFSLELFAATHLVLGILGLGRTDYVTAGLEHD